VQYGRSDLILFLSVEPNLSTSPVFRGGKGMVVPERCLEETSNVAHGYSMVECIYHRLVSEVRHTGFCGFDEACNCVIVLRVFFRSLAVAKESLLIDIDCSKSLPIGIRGRGHF
jgi:hypothetical protein